MNIGIDIRCLMEKNRTGVAEYTFGFLNSLFEKDSKNQYYLFYNSNKDVSKNIPKWGQENVHFIQKKYPNKLLNFFVWLRMIKLDKLTEKKLDYWFSPNLNFTNLSKKVKHIQTVHDLSFEIMPECFTNKQRLWHWFLKPKSQCKRANIILTPSENTKRDIISKYKMESKKVEVLYPAVSSHIKQNTVSNNLDLPEKYLLYLGTLEPRKNVLSIIEAYKNFELRTLNFELILAGSRGWKNKKVLEQIENTPGVRYIGYVVEEDKLGLYQNASLFVYPSLYEGFGLPVLEAMVSGVPVITSNRSSLPEVVGTSAYLVNPYNVDEIEKGMKLLLPDQDLRTKIIEKQKNQAEKFTWDKTTEEFLNLL